MRTRRKGRESTGRQINNIHEGVQKLVFVPMTLEGWLTVPGARSITQGLGNTTAGTFHVTHLPSSYILPPLLLLLRFLFLVLQNF